MGLGWLLVLVAARGAGVFVCWVWVVCVSRMVVRALAVLVGVGFQYR